MYMTLFEFDFFFTIPCAGPPQYVQLRVFQDYVGVWH